MRLANPLDDPVLAGLLNTALPDFILAFAFFTSVAYAVLGKRFQLQRPAIGMSVAIGFALSIGLVWWEQAIDPAASESMEILLTGTLRRLPQEVYLFVRENCRFVEVSPTGGQAFIVRRSCEHKRLILLASGADDSTIAHDIAHAWLGHQCPPSPDTMENVILQETAAWMAVKEWGWDVQAKIDYNLRLLHEYPMRRKATAE